MSNEIIPPVEGANEDRLIPPESGGWLGPLIALALMFYIILFVALGGLPWLLRVLIALD